MSRHRHHRRPPSRLSLAPDEQDERPSEAVPRAGDCWWPRSPGRCRESSAHLSPHCVTLTQPAGRLLPSDTLPGVQMGCGYLCHPAKHDLIWASGQSHHLRTLRVSIPWWRDPLTPHALWGPPPRLHGASEPGGDNRHAVIQPGSHSGGFTAEFRGEINSGERALLWNPMKRAFWGRHAVA